MPYSIFMIVAGIDKMMFGPIVCDCDLIDTFEVTRSHQLGPQGVIANSFDATRPPWASVLCAEPWLAR
jgi:hypothetical protein